MEHLNIAVNELKKSEQAVRAAETEMGIWDDEEEMEYIEEGGEQAINQAENQTLLTTPKTAIQTPMIPNTQGALYGAKTKTGTNKFKFKAK